MKKTQPSTKPVRTFDLSDLARVTGGREGRNPQTGETIQIPAKSS